MSEGKFERWARAGREVQRAVDALRAAASAFDEEGGMPEETEPARQYASLADTVVKIANTHGPIGIK